MKKYTQEEFDDFEVVDGVRICPTGDYSLIKRFGKVCSFGEGCEFENKGKAKLGYPFRLFTGFGSENRTIYFFNLESGIWVRAGCFFGNCEEFIEKTKRDGDDKKLKIYSAFVDIINADWS
jgi:hypothetical protein